MSKLISSFLSATFLAGAMAGSDLHAARTSPVPGSDNICLTSVFVIHADGQLEDRYLSYDCANPSPDSSGVEDGYTGDGYTTGSGKYTVGGASGSADSVEKYTMSDFPCSHYSFLDDRARIDSAFKSGESAEIDHCKWYVQALQYYDAFTGQSAAGQLAIISRLAGFPADQKPPATITLECMIKQESGYDPRKNRNCYGYGPVLGGWD